MSKIAGNDEVLRDEMIHLAHRAAHPDRYPLREALLKRHGNSKRAERARDHVCDINCCIQHMHLTIMCSRRKLRSCSKLIPYGTITSLIVI